MRLKTLALHGFKSFVQRTAIEFDTGITAIVGPNGSGKSNLADAFRWTLGEQSVRALRGRRTEDVLFAGGRGRPPAGFAEVSISFDAASPNGRARLDLPYAEISIARRAFRSGENEYYLNRDRVRLRDISDILGQIGLDADGFAVVGQGTVDSALSLRPGDRRALVEQAAGTGYLQSRLDESQSRLDQTRLNLERVTDLLGELEPRLRLLERQAKLARERDSVQAELWRLTLRWYGHLWSKPSSLLAVAAAELTLATVMAQRAQAALERLRDETASIESSGEEAERALSAEVSSFLAVQENHAKIARDIVSDQQRLALLRTRRAELTDALSHWLKALTDETANLDDIARRRREISDEGVRVDQELAMHERDLLVWNDLRRDLDSRRETCRRRFIASERSVSLTASQLLSVDDRRAYLTAMLAERAKIQGSLDGEIRAFQSVVEAKRAASQQAIRDWEGMEARRRQHELDRQEARKRLDQATAALGTLDHELQALRARADALSSVETSGAGYFPGVRAVLRAASESPDPKLSGVIGIVSRLLEVSPDIELAIEVALGGHGQDVVVERWNDAETAIAYLKSTNAGRATFLPLDTLRPLRVSDAPTGPGIVGVASDLVGSEPRLKVICRFLLGQSLVVEDLATTRQVMGRVPPGWQIVTLGGDIARASGAVTGGAPPTTRGQLARYREIREARRLLDELSRRRGTLVSAVVQNRADLDRATSQVAELQRQVATAHECSRRLAAELLDAENVRRRATEKHAWELGESERLRSELAAADRRRNDIFALVEAVEWERESADIALKEADEAIAGFANDTHDLTTLVRARRADRDLLRQRLAALEDDTRRGSPRRQGLEERARDAQQHLGSVESDITETERRLTMALDRVGEAAVSVSRAEHQVVERREGVATWRRRREADGIRRATLETDLQLATRRQQLAEKQVDRLAAELQGLRQQIVLELGPVDVAADNVDFLTVLQPDGTRHDEPVTPLVDADRVRDRIATLRSRLKVLPSGIDIVAEYDALRARIDGLTSQCDDLNRTAATLEAAISETSDTMRQRFDLTFADVSARFSQRFSDLFGGGTARLVVNSDGDSAGVEVYAQPPGKRNQSLATLSGGERALTAAALLFSLIEANPPPFCVLDEVDAALDDSNVVRFGGCLRELSEKTQFVVITHNRRTMEAASAIYGLTLEDRCETRLISMRLPQDTGDVGFRPA